MAGGFRPECAPFRCLPGQACHADCRWALICRGNARSIDISREV
jgi:hypothetical protein